MKRQSAIFFLSSFLAVQGFASALLGSVGESLAKLPTAVAKPSVQRAQSLDQLFDSASELHRHEGRTGKGRIKSVFVSSENGQPGVIETNYNLVLRETGEVRDIRESIIAPSTEINTKLTEMRVVYDPKTDLPRYELVRYSKPFRSTENQTTEFEVKEIGGHNYRATTRQDYSNSLSWRDSASLSKGEDGIEKLTITTESLTRQKSGLEILFPKDSRVLHFEIKNTSKRDSSNWVVVYHIDPVDGEVTESTYKLTSSSTPSVRSKSDRKLTQAEVEGLGLIVRLPNAPKAEIATAGESVRGMKVEASK